MLFCFSFCKYFFWKPTIRLCLIKQQLKVFSKLLIKTFGACGDLLDFEKSWCVALKGLWGLRGQSVRGKTNLFSCDGFLILLYENWRERCSILCGFVWFCSRAGVVIFKYLCKILLSAFEKSSICFFVWSWCYIYIIARGGREQKCRETPQKSAEQLLFLCTFLRPIYYSSAWLCRVGW